MVLLRDNSTVFISYNSKGTRLLFTGIKKAIVVPHSTELTINVLETMYTNLKGQ